MYNQVIFMENDTNSKVIVENYFYRIDSYMMKRYDQTGFMPPGRPKRWRQKCFHVLEEAVQAKYAWIYLKK